MADSASDSLFNPYPGLRPFQSDEDYLFFGREEQTSDLLRRLSQNRFVAVVGSSGSGKSSLVRCGLLSELHGGGLVDAGSYWEVATMRPGGDPMRHLAEALISAELYDPDDAEALDRVMATLKRSDAGLVEAARQSDLEEGGNLLVVVDQFEEIFRFHEAGSAGAEEAPDFIQLLLEASRSEEVPVYVILTMRSDFLGDCSRFAGLAEAVNNGEYLIPRLNRDQTRKAIEGPAKVAGGTISWRLLVKLLNDLEGQSDRLPVLQHGLMRLWDAWARDHEQDEPLDLRHYEVIGGLNEALSIHADEIYHALPNDHDRLVAAKLFKALTEKAMDNRGIRRPSPLWRLQAIAEDDRDAVALVINAYRQPGVTFLMPGEETALQADSVIDISHESLMRVWKRLQDWVEDESQSARIYRRLHETGELYVAGQAGLYHDPDLQIAQAWRDETHPNAAWADQYGGEFERTMTFLEQSEAQARRAEREAEASRQRELEQAQALAQSQAKTAALLKRFAVVIGAACLIAVGLAGWAIQQSSLAKAQTALARKAEKKAQHAQGKTWLSNARSLATDRDPFSAGLKAARALGFEKFGRDGFSEAQSEHFPVLLDSSTPEWTEAIQLARGTNAQTLLWQSGLLSQHPGEINDLTISPDGRWMVSVSEDEDLVRVWNLLTGDLVEQLESTVGNVETIAFSPDGRFLAFGGGTSLGFYQFTGRAWTPHGETFSILNGNFRSLAFSPDGQWLAMGHGNGDLYLWRHWNRFENFPEEPTMAELHEGRVVDLEFSPVDSNLLATAGRYDRKVHLINVLAAQILKTLEPIEEHSTNSEANPVRLWSIAFSADGSQLVTAGNRMPVTVWELATGEPAGMLLQREWQLLSRQNNGSYRSDNTAFMGECVSVSQDGSTLAVAWFKSGGAKTEGIQFPTVSLFDWDATSGWNPKAKRDIIVETSEIYYARLTPDGKRLVTSSTSGDLQLWDVEQGGPVGGDPKGHFYRIDSLAFSRDGLRFASGDGRGIVSIWEARTGELLHRFRAHQDRVEKLKFSADGKTLFSIGYRDETFNVWDTTTAEPRFSERFDFNLESLAVSPDGKEVFVGGWRRELSVYDASSLAFLRVLKTSHYTNEIRFFPTGDQLAALHAVDGSLMSFFEISDDRSQLSQTTRIPSPMHDSSVTTFAMSPDGNRLATAAIDVKIWERRSDGSWGEARRPKIPDQATKVTAIAFDPTGTLLATGAQRDVRLWDAETGELRQALPHVQDVRALAFSPDGQLLVTGSWRGLLQVWSLNAGKRMVGELTAIGSQDRHWFFKGSRSLALAPKRQLLFTESPEGSHGVTAWSLRTPQPTFSFELTFAENAGENVEFAISPDEQYLAAGRRGSDSVYLWDLETREARQFVFDDPRMRGLAFSGDGRRLIALSRTQFQIWDVASGQLVGKSDRTFGSLHGCVMTPDGERLVLAGQGVLQIRRFDPQASQWVVEHDLAATTGPNLGYTGVATSTDGRLLAVPGDKVCLVDLTTMGLIGEPLVHDHWTFCAAFSPDGSRLATGGGGNQVIVSSTDVSRDIILTIFEDPSESIANFVTDLAFSESGDTLYVGRSDGRVQIWEIPANKVMTNSGNYLDVVTLEETSADLQWQLSSTSLSATHPRTFAPITARYLTGLNRVKGEEAKRATLFSRYFDQGFYRSAHAVFASMTNEERDQVASSHREALIDRVLRPLQGRRWETVALLDLTEAVFEKRPLPLALRLRLAMATHDWPRVLRLLEADVPVLPAEERRQTLEGFFQALNYHGDALINRIDSLQPEDSTLPPLVLLTAYALERYAKAVLEHPDRGVPTPGFTTLPAARLYTLMSPIPDSILEPGAPWHYHAQLGSPPNDWRELGANLDDWQQGPAPFGFGTVSGGNIKIATQLGDLASQQLTYYFRTTLDVAEDVEGLSLSLLRDDGVVLYLNGKEVYRDNLPSGTITPETVALSAISGTAESQWLEVTLPDTLPIGTHVLAAEVHQNGLHSSDLTFDLAIRRAMPSLRTPDVLAQTLALCRRLDRDAEMLPWLAAFEDDVAHDEKESEALLQYRLQVELAFGTEPEQVLTLVDHRIAVLAGVYSPAAIAERKRWLAHKEALITEMGRPETEIEAVRRALWAAPPRDPTLDQKQIDLTDFYNASIYDVRGWVGSAGSDLRTLPESFVPLHGVPFDLRGAISLNSGELPAQPNNPDIEGHTINSHHNRNYPDKVTGIAVNQSSSAIHFLMSCHWGRETEPVEVARFVMHYEDGSQETMPVTFLEDVQDWWVSSSRQPIPEEKIGYRGRTGGDTSDIALSELIWENPHPDKIITHIDFVSSLRAAAPFLLGITLE